MKRNVDQHASVASSFRLDAINQCAWLGSEPISLSPKAFAVLSYLAQRPNKLVTKDELLDAVWPDVHVTEGVLKRAVLEVRKALNDSAEEPRFIQTLHRRGYRFLVRSDSEPHPPASVRNRPEITGREMELFQLDTWFERATGERRQLVFVTGEFGLGKSALLDCWIKSLRERLSGTPGAAVVSRERCIRHFGPAEPFSPLFGILEDLARQLGRRLVEALRASAPAWLLEMPALHSADDRAFLRNEDARAGRQRMLRELADALESLSREIPLVIVLEDLQWSDPSTIDFLSAIGRRTSPARLLVIGTYRPADAACIAPELLTVQAELEVHNECEVLPLDHLSTAEANEYLSAICQEPVSAATAEAICRRANGNPLFLSAIAAGLRRSGRSDVEAILPDTLRQIFEQQTALLSDREQMLLRTAALAGETFSIPCIAKALQWDEADAETVCDALVRRHRVLKAIVASEDEPERYTFVHVLFRDAIANNVPAGLRNRNIVPGPAMAGNSAGLRVVSTALRPSRALAGEAAA